MNLLPGASFHYKTRSLGKFECPSVSRPRHHVVCSAYTDDLKEYFLKRAPGYEKDNIFHPKMARKLVDLMALRKGEMVLDVATGTGYVAAELARKLGSQGLVFGVDISSPMLQRARANLDEQGRAVAKCILMEADVEQVHFHGQCFQHITCSASLPYFQDIPGFFAKARSWLLPGGSLVFNTPEEPYTLLKPLLFSIYHQFGIPAVNSGPVIGSVELIHEVLRRAGFTDIQVQKETDHDSVDEIVDVEAYVESQWRGMLNMPLVNFAIVKSSTTEAAHQQFCSEGMRFLKARINTAGKVYTKPLATLWTIAK